MPDQDKHDDSMIHRRGEQAKREDEPKTGAAKAKVEETKKAEAAEDSLEFGSGKEKPDPVPVDKEHETGSTVPV